jgi:hypothetical protein
MDVLGTTLDGLCFFFIITIRPHNFYKLNRLFSFWVLGLSMKLSVNTQQKKKLS